MPSFRTLVVPAAIHAAMLQQARTELPNECCGLLAGRIVGQEGRVEKCYPLVNAAASRVEYLSDGQSMFDAVRDMIRQGIDILAVYHSHPTSEPVPSKKDMERNYDPDVVNLIIGLKEEPPFVRGWWLTETAYREAVWRVEP